ncbi:hypothetical protein L596_025510 [Steinernema carpocapsae]|uniref:C-type lectin domain-containing protein n=1 Tax=Steinernema carpocapsae TaxID=34508 RepID=A0A4U5M7Y2_STECR|nr:hypothetical protein L596_025510 [Steinernema carpocapsae]
MWFHVSLAVFCLTLSVQADLNRRYQGTKLRVEIDQWTADCDGAGTDSDVTLNVGFIGTDNKLVYSVRTKSQKGKAADRFEQKTVHGWSFNVPQKQAVQIEQDCVTYSKGDQEAYEDCFHPNLIYYEMYSWWNNWGHGWKPSLTDVTLFAIATNGDIYEHDTVFNLEGACEYDWVDGEGDSYFCRDTRPGLRMMADRGNGLKKGDWFDCDKEKRKLVKHKSVNDEKL